MSWDLLASLPEEDRAEILAAAIPRTFDRAQVLVHDGDPADSLYLIVDGRVAVQVSTPSGDRATLTILGAGDWFGELALVRPADRRRRTATVVALETTRTLSLPATTFETLRTQHPAFDRLLVAALAGRVEQLSDRLLEALYVGVDRRLYSCLLELANVYGDRSVPVSVPLTQDQVAGLVGGTRPTVNQSLHKLQEQGVVELHRGWIVIRDLTTLARKADRSASR